MERNTFKNEFFILSPVTDFSVITGDFFDSGDADINDFFINDALRHFRHGMAVTYSLCALGLMGTPLGFISIQNDSLKVNEEIRVRSGFPYKSFPAVKIGRLGIHKDFQGQEIGTTVIAMLVDFMRTANRTGCRIMTVDAYNTPYVIKFYEKNGFRPIRDVSPEKATAPMYRDLF